MSTRINLRAPTALLALVALLMALALPAQALAQAGNPNVDPTASQYNNPSDTGGGNEEEPAEQTVALTSTGGDDGTSGFSSSSSLPFTGFDVGVLALVALLLGATGLALRRLSSVR